MLKLTIVVLACILALSNGQSIVPQEFHPKNIGSLALNGAHPIGCASTADGLQDVRLQGCTSAPCSLSRGQTYSLEVDFRSRDMHCCMSMGAIFLQGTNRNVVANDVPAEGNLQAGQVYTFRYNLQVPSGVNTGAQEFRLKVYQNYVHEICLVIPVNIA